MSRRTGPQPRASRPCRKLRALLPWTSVSYDRKSIQQGSHSRQFVPTGTPREHKSAMAAFRQWLPTACGRISLRGRSSGITWEFAAIMAYGRSGDPGLIDQERKLLGFTHFEVGAEMMSRWNCPIEVRHATLSSQNAELDFSRPLPLAAVVKSATLLADAQAMSVFDLNQWGSGPGCNRGTLPRPGYRNSGSLFRRVPRRHSRTASRCGVIFPHSRYFGSATGRTAGTGKPAKWSEISS